MDSTTKYQYEWGRIHGVNPKGEMYINGVLYESEIIDSNGEPCGICERPSVDNFVLICVETRERRDNFRCEEC